MSGKGQEISRWLEKSTEDEWKEMKIIRERLEKLEEQKKKLAESQREGPGNRMFRMRSMHKKNTPNTSLNLSFNNGSGGNFNPEM